MKNVVCFILSAVIVLSSFLLICNFIINPMQIQAQAELIPEEFFANDSVDVSIDDCIDTESYVDASSNTVVELRKVDFSSLKSQNSDTAGWLILNNNCQLPVVQNNQKDADNKYLHTSFDGSHSKEGTLFLSSDVSETSDVAIIYGHNMKSGAMFGTLPLYRSLDYVKANPTFEFASANDGVVNRYKIVAVCSVSTNYVANDFYYPQADYSSAEEFNEFVRKVKSYSFFTMDDFSYGDKVVILNTCAYGFEGERTIVVGVLDNTSVIDVSSYGINNNRVNPLP